MAAPDELPILRPRCFPERVTHYGKPGDSFVRVVDTLDERAALQGVLYMHRTVFMRAPLEFVSIEIEPEPTALPDPSPPARSG